MIKREYPHEDWIKENETITIPSVFMLEGGATELFPFLLGCKQKNCTVVFENEGITVRPTAKDHRFDNNMVLAMYAYIAEDDTIVRQYLKYVMDIRGKQ